MKDFLRCLLLPIANKTLIVPYSAVAEIISYVEPIAQTGEPKWVMGDIHWRGKTIPLISIEKMDDKSLKSEENSIPESRQHIAVLNRIDDVPIDFIAIILKDVPIMHRYKTSDFKRVGEPKEPYLIMEVLAREIKAFIPNIKWLEESVTKTMTPTA